MEWVGKGFGQEWANEVFEGLEHSCGFGSAGGRVSTHGH